MGTGISIIRKNVNTAGNPGKRRLTNHPDFRHFASFFFPFASESAGSVESYDLIVIELIAKGFPEHIFKLIIQLVDSLDARIWLTGLPVGTHGESTNLRRNLLRGILRASAADRVSSRVLLVDASQISGNTTCCSVLFFACFPVFLILVGARTALSVLYYLNQAENQ